MKLVLSIVHNRDKNRLSDALIRAGFKFTIIGTTGGFLREGNATFMIGIEDEELELLKELIAANCQQREQIVNVSQFETPTPVGMVSSPVKVPVGGAVVFVLPIEHFEHY